MWQVEKKITEELAEAGLLATADKPEAAMPEYGDLAKLTYLSCVIKEAMRMYTVSTMSADHVRLHCVITPILFN